MKDVKCYPLQSKNVKKESSTKCIVDIPDEFDSKLVQECREYNLHTPKTSNVKVEEKFQKVLLMNMFPRCKQAGQMFMQKVQVKM